MDFILLWIEGVSLLLLWAALVLAIDAQLPRGRWIFLAALLLTGAPLALLLLGVTAAAIALHVPFAIGFFGSAITAAAIGKVLLFRYGRRSSEPGLATRVHSWPWKRLALGCAVAAALFATTLHDMSVSAGQLCARETAELQQMLSLLNPPPPLALNSAPIYEAAYPHLVRVDDVPGARAALEQLEGNNAPASLALAAPLQEWVEKNRVALGLASRAAALPGYSTLEETTYRTWLFDRTSRQGKVAGLELARTRPDDHVVGHVTGRKRLGDLLEVEALRSAAGGQRTRAIEKENELLALERHGGYRAELPLQVLEKMFAVQGWTDEELAVLDLRAPELHTRLQLMLANAELADLETLTAIWMLSLIPPNGHITRVERAGLAFVNVGRALFASAAMSSMVEANRADYDDLWKALYSDASVRYADLEQLARKERSSRLFLPLDNRLRSITTEDARHSCAETAVAIARFRLHHGRLPETLTELAPEQLLEIPVDPFDGQPLRYRRDGEAAIIYSVGPDRKDNSGKVETYPDGEFIEQGSDLVFHLPALR